jgi:hypothetical protein
VAAAAWTRIVWFLIPATIIGMNGLVFLFCAVTDLWEVWAAIWPVELLSIGLSLLLVNVWVRSKGLFTAGIILSVMAGFGFALMALVLTGWVSVIAAFVLIGTGVLLLGRNALPELSGGASVKGKLTDTYSEEDVVRIKEAA